MAKKLLLDALSAAIGDYVEGINEQNLKVGLWDGKVLLNNVALNVSKFREMNLPVNIYYGSCDTIELMIPWSNLGKEAVKVRVVGVYLLAGPLDEHDLTPENCQKRQSESLRSFIESADSKDLASVEAKRKESEETDKEPGWASSLILKIVDNIQISVESLHIRYQHPGNDGACMAAGLTLNSFTVRSADENWEDADFVTRTKGQHLLLKRSVLDCLAVYVDVNGEDIRGADVRTKMLGLIARGNSSTLPLERYVVSPLSFEARATRNEKPKGRLEHALTVGLHITRDVDLNIHQQQYRQLLGVQQSFSRISRTVAVRSHPDRPSVPVLKSQKGDPEAWLVFWTAVLAKKRLESKAMQVIRLREKLGLPNIAALKEMYLEFAKRLKVKTFTELKIKPLSDEESKLFGEIEMALPPEVCLKLRFQGNAELSSTRKAKAASKSSWWFSKAPASDGDIAIADIASQGEELNGLPIPSSKIVFSGGGNFRLWGAVPGGAEEEILLTTGTGRTSGEFSIDLSSMGYDAALQLSDLELIDHVTPTPLYPRLITTLLGSGSGKRDDIIWNDGILGMQVGELDMPIFASSDILVGVKKTSGIDIKVRSRSFQFALNPPLVVAVLAVLAPPKGTLEELSKNMSREAQKVADIAYENASENASPMNVDIRAGAPQVILPIDCSSQCGELLLDTGVLVLQGGLGGGAFGPGILSKWKIDLQNVNAILGLPGDPNGCVLERFDIALGVTMRSPHGAAAENGSAPQIELTASIDKPLQGRLSPAKLNDLLYIMLHIAPSIKVPAQIGDRILVVDDTIDLSRPESVEPDNPRATTLLIITAIKSMRMHLTADDAIPILNLSADGLSFSMQQRDQDLSMTVSLKDLNLLDLCRPTGTDNCLVSSSQFLSADSGLVKMNKMDDQPMVSIHVVMINGPFSPFLKDDEMARVGMSVRVMFARLRACFNASAINRVKPFYTALLSAGKESSVAIVAPQGLTSPHLEVVVPRRMSVHVTIDEISAELVSERSEGYVPVIRAAIQGLKCGVVMEQGMNVDLSLDSVALSDTRPETRGWHYRDIIYPTYEIVRHSSRAIQSISDDEDEDLSCLFTPLLVLKYETTPEKAMSEVEITLTNFRSYFIVPSVAASLDVALDITKAVLNMIDTRSPLSSEASTGNLQVTPSAERNLVLHEKSTMKIGVGLQNPLFVFVQDPSRIDSSGIVLETKIRLGMLSESQGIDVDTTFNVSIENLEAFVNLNVSGPLTLFS